MAQRHIALRLPAGLHGAFVTTAHAYGRTPAAEARRSVELYLLERAAYQLDHDPIGARADVGVEADLVELRRVVQCRLEDFRIASFGNPLPPTSAITAIAAAGDDIR